MESKSSQKLAVIGANSMVGSRFCELQKSFQLIEAGLHGNSPIDLTSNDSIESFFKNNDFYASILFSAFTNVDEAELQRNDKNDTAWKVNVTGAQTFAEFSKKYSRKLIFLSTDFIFDGEKGPYSENDKPGENLERVSWYGITKLEAERALQNLLEDLLILRIAYPYRAKFEKKDDFARQILRKYDEGKLYPMFEDQILTPTFIDDLPEAISLLLEKNQKGIFHLASPKVVTPYEFASKLLRTFGKNTTSLKKGNLEKFLLNKNTTPRPVKGGLIVEKISELGFRPTSWEEGIDKLYKQIGDN